jgi:hypothetical protein
MSDDFTLTGDGPSAATPGSQVTQWHEMVGKTIRCVVERPAGRQSYDVPAVLLFEDGCWAVLGIDEDGACRLADDGFALADYLGAKELLREGLITTAQYEHLIHEQKEAVRAAMRRKRDSLLVDLSILNEGLGET